MDKRVSLDEHRQKPRLKLVPFDDIKLVTERNYLVKGWVPGEGLVIVWGPPKCGKSFLIFDMVMHVALGWEYRGRKVVQGPVVYLAAEGAHGFKARIEAFRQRHLPENHEPPAFYLVGATIDLIGDHAQLIAAITANAVTPAAVVIDTLNRSLNGSESSDEDMADYIRAADAIREKFNCAVIIVHHCGINDKRPRGHTSLTGAADAQISIKRDKAKNIIATLEWMKDGPEGEVFASALENVDVGEDDDGDNITSCVVVPVDAPPPSTGDRGPKLTANQSTMLTVLGEAGPDGLTVDEWNEKAREVGIGTKRKATLYDIRNKLKDKKLVHSTMDRWYVTHV